MNKLGYVIIICTILFGTNACSAKQKENLPDIQLIPLPQEVVKGEGVFQCTPDITISLHSSDLKTEIITLQETFIKVFGKPLKVIETNSKKNNKLVNEINLEISNSLNDHETFGEEGYNLEVEKKGVKITATTSKGIFYGIQTLRQLILLSSNQQNKNNAIKINCLTIRDKPKLEWRGVLLDPARYFLPIELLKKYINTMAFYKMNRLQLHLTDDHGWTVEMVKYPELNNQEKWPPGYRTRHNGNMYTREQIKDLVAYAKERNIIIIPEFEQPGHNSILALTKPDILCKTNSYRTDKNFAVADFPESDIDNAHIRKQMEGCLGNEETLKVYENILTEFMEIFPSKYIHIGGDEYYGIQWAKCPDDQRLIEEEGLEEKYDTKERQELFANSKGDKKKYILYLHLMNHLADFVTSQGRIPVLWDDLAWRGDFPKDAIIMQWHYKGGQDGFQRIETPENPAVEAALAGHKAIIAPYNSVYFDLDIPLKDVYFFDPIPKGLPDEAKKLILGPHACVWNQPIDSVFSKTFPRFYALSQIGWSCDMKKDFTDFENRIKVHDSKILNGLIVGELENKNAY